MVSSIKQLLHVAILSLILPFVSGFTYHLDSTCSSNAGFVDAVKEVISVAGRMSEALRLRDSRLNDPLRWFFDFEYGADAHFIPYVRDTYDRIGKLTPAASASSANLRLYCDNNARYKAVNDAGSEIPWPSDFKSTAFLQQKFYDKANEAFVLGANLECQSKGALAHTTNGISEMYSAITMGRSVSSQPDNRVTITFCDSLFAGNTAVRPYTWKGFGQRKLDNLSKLPMVTPLAANTIMHEFAHVAFLSSQRYTQSSAETASPKLLPFGTDKHPRDGTETNGYYMVTDMKPPGSKLFEPEYVIMNPDSYAYAAAVYRLRDRQWEGYQDPSSGFIKMRKNLNFPLVE